MTAAAAVQNVEANVSDFTGRDAIGWAQDSRRPLVVEMLKKAQSKH